MVSFITQRNHSSPQIKATFCSLFSCRSLHKCVNGSKLLTQNCFYLWFLILNNCFGLQVLSKLIVISSLCFNASTDLYNVQTVDVHRQSSFSRTGLGCILSEICKVYPRGQGVMTRGREWLFPGGSRGGFGPRAQGGIRGGGFWHPKIDQFWSNFKNKTNLGLKYTKFA